MAEKKVIPAFGKIIHLLRTLTGKTDSEFAKAVGVSEEQLNRIESGKEAVEDPKVLDLIAKEFGMSVGTLRYFQQDPSEAASEGDKRRMVEVQDFMEKLADLVSSGLGKKIL